MYLCNKERYGYLNVPAKPHHTLEDDRLNFVHVHLESMSKWTRGTPCSGWVPFCVMFIMWSAGGLLSPR